MFNNPAVRLTIGVGVPIASALMMEQLPKTGVAEVPFAFQVETRTLPPGTYSVKQSDEGPGVTIQNQKIAGEGKQCVAAKRRFGPAQEARLVFHRHEGHFFLSEIWFDGDGRGLILQEGRLHQEARSTADVTESRDVSFR